MLFLNAKMPCYFLANVELWLRERDKTISTKLHDVIREREAGEIEKLIQPYPPDHEKAINIQSIIIDCSC